MSAPPPTDEEASSGAGDPPDDELLAGELVLGVLDAEQRRAAQQRSATDPAFAAHIAGWEQRLAPWLSEIEPIAVPADLWSRVRHRLGWLNEAGKQPRWWASLTLWRAATALAVLAALALWILRPAATPRAELTLTTPVTVLAQSDGRPGWLASVDGARGTVLLVPVPRAPDAQGRVAELWIIPAGRAPRSLGQIAVNRSQTVMVPADARTALSAAGTVLAITLEPLAGMPHAAPSGPVIATGPVQS